VKQANERDQQSRSQEGSPAREGFLLPARLEEGGFEDFHLVGVQYPAAGADESLDVPQDVFGVGFGHGHAAIARAGGFEGEFDAVGGGEGGDFLDGGDVGVVGG